MKRREFITLFSGAAAMWPLAARAQQPGKMARIGVLVHGLQSRAEWQQRTVAFQQGLESRGWFEGRNIHILWRFSANKARKAPCGGVCRGGRSGVGGAKGGGQGEYAPAKHVLDSEPGSRVTGAGAYTATCAVTHPRQEPYAGKPHVRIWAGGVP